MKSFGFHQKDLFHPQLKNQMKFILRICTFVRVDALENDIELVLAFSNYKAFLLFDDQRRARCPNCWNDKLVLMDEHEAFTKLYDNVITFSTGLLP